VVENRNQNLSGREFFLINRPPFLMGSDCETPAGSAAPRRAELNRAERVQGQIK